MASDVRLNPDGVFARVSRLASRALGHPIAFSLAVGGVVLWCVLGPLFHFSDAWQLTINTATTIVTFLMVFLIQHTQNHQGDAIQLKLNELIRAVEGAHNTLIDLEDASEADLVQLNSQYQKLRERAQHDIARGISDTNAPDLQSCTDQAHNQR